MLTSVSVRNFRCFEDLSLSSLGRVNLISGRNNAGKTALLEALFLLGGGNNIYLIPHIASIRIPGINSSGANELIFSALFPSFNPKTVIEIDGWIEESHKIGIEIELLSSHSTYLNLANDQDFSQDRVNSALELRYWNNRENESHIVQYFQEGSGLRVIGGELLRPPFPAFYLPSNSLRPPEENAEQLSQLEISKASFSLLESLQIIEPRLNQLKVIYLAGKPLIYGDIGLDRLLPLSLMGEGIGHLTSLLLAIANTPHGVVLIDEIENGFHYSILPQIWQVIDSAARSYNTQIFATTHSYECLQAAHKSFSQQEVYDFRFHRLTRSEPQQIRAVTYDQEALEAAIAAEFEVR